MSLRAINRGKKTASKLSDNSKNINDSINEDKIVLEGLNKKITDGKSEIKKDIAIRERVRTETEKLEEILNSKKTDIETIESKMNAVRIQLKYEEDRNIKVISETSQQLLDTKESQRNEINKNNDTILAQKKDIGDKFGEVESLRIKKIDMDGEISRVSENIKKSQQTIEDLNKLIDNFKVEQQSLQRKVEAKDNELKEKEKLNTRLEETKRQITETTTKLTNKKEEIETLDKFILEEKAKIEDTKEKQKRTNERQDEREKFLEKKAETMEKRAKTLQKYFDQHNIKITIK